MNALRSPNTTLKLLTLSSSWRKPESTRSSLGLIKKYSSAGTPNEAEPQRQHESGGAVDPFGLGDVMNASDKASSLVQGFYREKNRKEQPPSSSLSPPETATAAAQQMKTDTDVIVEFDSEKQSRLYLYNRWIKQRIDREASLNVADGDVTESYRQANFGQIRVDSDNPVNVHAYVPREDRNSREDDFKISNNPNPGRTRSHPDRTASAVTDKEPIVETIQANYSVRMRASDFLKQMKEKSSNVEGNSDNPREKILISRVVNPKARPALDADDPVNYASTREEAVTMDSNVVPKPYLLPDYNRITSEDMWNVLRKTVIFENDFVFAINKPSGIPVHSKSRDCRHTVIQFLDKFADMAKVPKIYPLHRIDKETTGVLLFAKDQKVASVIKEKFANRQIDKVYLGVTKLCPRVPEGIIKIPIGEGIIPGTTKYRRVLRPDLREYGLKPTLRSCVEAITGFRVLHTMKEASFLEIEPQTGCKHQIRVHLGIGLGCPIFGDHKYSHRDRLAPQRLHPHVLNKIKLKQTKVREMPLHLHCNKISFTLPEEFTKSTEPVYIHAKIPHFMKYTLKQLNLIR